MKLCFEISFYFLLKQSQISRSVLQARSRDLSYKTDLDIWDCFGKEKHTVLYTKKYVNLKFMYILIFQCSYIYIVPMMSESDKYDTSDKLSIT